MFTSAVAHRLSTRCLTPTLSSIFACTAVLQKFPPLFPLPSHPSPHSKSACPSGRIPFHTSEFVGCPIDDGQGCTAACPQCAVPIFPHPLCHIFDSPDISDTPHLITAPISPTPHNIYKLDVRLCPIWGDAGKQTTALICVGSASSFKDIYFWVISISNVFIWGTFFLVYYQTLSQH